MPSNSCASKAAASASRRSGRHDHAASDMHWRRDGPFAQVVVDPTLLPRSINICTRAPMNRRRRHLNTFMSAASLPGDGISRLPLTQIRAYW